MRKLHNLKLIGLVTILAVTLIFTSISFVEAQSKAKGKPPDTGKPPKCNNNGICEKGESEDCPDCQQQEIQPLEIDQSGLQIVTGGFENRVYQIKYKDGEYKNTWTSKSLGAVTRAVSIGDADNDGQKEIITTVNFGKGRGKKGRNHQKIFLYEDGSTGDPSWESPNLGYSLTGVRDSIIANADNDSEGTKEIILVENMHIEIYRLTYDQNSNTYNFEFLWRSPEYSSSIWSVDVGDADNDSENEVVLSLFGIGSAVVYEYIGDNTWGNPVTTDSICSCNIDIAKVRDADNDDFNEIIGGGTSNALNVWKYIGGAYVNVFLGDDLGGYTQGVGAGDVNGDGDNEIILGSSMGSDYSKLCVFQFLFVDPDNYIYQLEPLNSIPISGVDKLTVGDVDGDGIDEIVLGFKGITVFDFESGNLKETYNFPYEGYLTVDLEVG